MPSKKRKCGNDDLAHSTNKHVKTYSENDFLLLDEIFGMERAIFMMVVEFLQVAGGREDVRSLARTCRHFYTFIIRTIKSRYAALLSGQGLRGKCVDAKRFWELFLQPPDGQLLSKKRSVKLDIRILAYTRGWPFWIVFPAYEHDYTHLGVSASLSAIWDDKRDPETYRIRQSYIIKLRKCKYNLSVKCEEFCDSTDIYCRFKFSSKHFWDELEFNNQVIVNYLEDDDDHATNHGVVGGH